VDSRVSQALRRLLVRAATQAEDRTVASLSALERICYMLAEETPALVLVAAEYVWRKFRYGSPLEARDFVVTRVLKHYSVESSLLSVMAGAA
jgi:hypothetical protein